MYYEFVGLEVNTRFSGIDFLFFSGRLCWHAFRCTLELARPLVGKRDQDGGLGSSWGRRAVW